MHSGLRVRRAAVGLGIVALAVSSVVFAPSIASGATITQSSPISGTIDVAGSSTFSAPLSATGYDASGVTFTWTSAPTTPGLVLSGSQITTTGTLPANTYTISGTDQDQDGTTDTGTWSYSLTVSADPIVQTSPTTGSVPVSTSSSFTTTLSAGISGVTSTVAFTWTSAPTTPGLVLSGSQITTTGALVANTYSISGVDSDTDGDTGTWSYTLTVTPGSITQGSPTAGTVSVAGSSSFASTLTASSGVIGTVTFTRTSSPDGLTLTGSQIGTTGTLAANSYSISGNDIDSSGDTGTWSYVLTVTSASLVQTSPTSGTTSSNGSSTFNPGSLSVSNATGSVTFTQTSSPDGLTLNNGQLATTASLAAGVYTISGTDQDAYGDTGTWIYSLTVTASAAIDTSLTQTSPTSATTSAGASSSFDPGSLSVDNNSGAVTYVTRVSSSALTVSAAGLIKITGSLIPGVYTVSGTDSDQHGDTGIWTYTLTVTGVSESVTFNANGGTGSMAVESHYGPSALTINEFTRDGYSFVDWNTEPNGSGQSYANGASFPFASATTLYAQWKAGRTPSHTVTFKPNGGSGSMSPETANTATALSPNHFTRAGYTFVNWNSSLKGTGASYADDATYPFKTSTVLYAQWKKNPKKTAAQTVTFKPNGGSGSMSPETANTATALSPNHLTRSGYKFVAWNTAPTGSGTTYANGALYSFKASITLFAQWKRDKVVVIPAVHATVTVGPFTTKSSVLTSALESEIVGLANTIKKGHDTKISLVGFGDKLSSADELNEATWAANFTLSEHRADAVETYLEDRLALEGYSTYTINAVGGGSATPGTSPVAQSNSDLVIAKLT